VLGRDTLGQLLLLPTELTSAISNYWYNSNKSMANEIIDKETGNRMIDLGKHVSHEKRIVSTSLNYYSDPGDGSPPTPVVVGG
jgi:hypothetical protein